MKLSASYIRPLIAIGSLWALTASAQPKSEVVPRIDPPDQLFRRAPMSKASRSLVVPMGEGFHIAYDTKLLRPHTVWKGSPLQLVGPPYSYNKRPFICGFEGERLWGLPPFIPLFLDADLRSGIADPPLRAEYRGVSSKDGEATLLYDFRLKNGRLVSIQETPRIETIEERSFVVRRFEVSARDAKLTLLVHAEMGSLADWSAGNKGRGIQREGDVVIVLARSNRGIGWQDVGRPVKYEEQIFTDDNTEEGKEYVSVEGRQHRLFVDIPAEENAAVVEVASAVFEELPSADFGQAWHSAAAAPPDLNRVYSEESGESRPLFKVGADPDFPRRLGGSASYRIEYFPVPEEIELLATGMDWMEDGSLAVCTWPGEIYIVENPTGPVEEAAFRRYARGLNEPLGLNVHKGEMYVVQKGELTRIRDTDGDGAADLQECVNDDWGYTGNYHAFSFGPLIDDEDNFYVFPCGQRGRWDVPLVGWAFQASPDGARITPHSSGLRVPNGVGFFGPDQDLFVADNQGNWIGTCKINHLRQGHFYGFPSGIPAPKEQYDNPADFTPPTVWLPRELSPSASGMAEIKTDAFGPFQGQMLVGDFQNGIVMRVQLEKVGGEWQGAVVAFLKGFMGAVNRLSFGPDGCLYVGGCRRTWSTPAPREYSLDRVRFTGTVPFEIRSVHANSDGFELEFTEPVGAVRASDPENYLVTQFRYHYHQKYGSNEYDHEDRENSRTEIRVAAAEVSEDGLKVKLKLDGLKAGYVTQIRPYAVTNLKRKRLENDTMFYTLNRIPE